MNGFLRFLLLQNISWEKGLVALCLTAMLSGPVLAADMPTAAGSPIAGIAFDDRPLMLPVQRNFQMAMLTASSELGRSCGRMEAYGWRLSGEEQQRVNQLFNNTVDRLRAQGYVIETKESKVVSRDVTLFTADREDKNLIFLWSAGEIGLVMVMCETSAPLMPVPQNVLKSSEQAATLPSQLPMDQTLRAPASLRNAAEDLRKPPSFGAKSSVKGSYENFSPVGKWIGDYTCSQGTTGATLQMESLKGDQFKGTFSFYPTSRNPYVPAGKYEVFGEYDRESLRILINPGKWIKQPKGYFNTVMIGSFDPANRTFSAYFQGISGCTSFEAHQDGDDRAIQNVEQKESVKAVKETPKKEAKKKAKKKVVKKKEDQAVLAPKEETAIAPAAAPVPAETSPRSSSLEPPAGIDLGAPQPVETKPAPAGTATDILAPGPNSPN